MNPTDMENTAEAVSGYMKLLAAPARLMILCQLVDGECAAGELSQRLGMKPPAVSQHLARLRQEGILTTRRDGQTIYYSILDPMIADIMMFLYDAFCGPAAATRRARGARPSKQSPSSRRSSRHA